MDIKKNNSPVLKRVLLVESARGAAAIYVCLHHLILIGHLTEFFKFGKFLFYPFSFGPEAVYLFFFLSGFSIHYSNLNRSLGTLGKIGNYYYQRLRRIYPIFLIAVGLAIVLGFITSCFAVISDTTCRLDVMGLSFVLLFLSDWHAGAWHSGLANDPALWSLSYEIPYYLAYPIFWNCCKRFGANRSFGASLLASGVFIMFDCFQPNHISNIFSLYWLWTCGALMAEWKVTNKSFSVSPAAYFFLVFLCYAVSQSVEAVAIPVINWNLEAVTIGIVIFSTYINFKQMLLSERMLAAGGIILLMLVFLLATRDVPTWGRHFFLDARLIFASGVLSLLLIADRSVASLCGILAKPFLGLGAMSYALYVIHMPIFYFVADVMRQSGTSFFWMPFALLPTLIFAWWLETKLQPRVTCWLDLIRTKITGVFLVAAKNRLA